MAEPLRRDELQEPVSRHMRHDFVSLRDDQTVGQALEAVRRLQPEGRIIYFYVADAGGRLLGVVPTRRLLLTPSEAPLRDIMVRQVVAIPHTATVLDACEFSTLHRLLAFPVIDDDRRLVGLVDVDLYTREMSEVGDIERREGNEDLFQLVGVHLTDARQSRPFAAFRQRFPWLLANVSGGIAAAFLSGLFEAELRRAVALALFIPVVLALAESVSIQSVSLALQALHGPRRPTWAAAAARLRHELLTGATLGAACGLLVALAALAWIGHPHVAASVLGGIAGGVTAAALLGAAIPTLLRALRRDPQVAAGPIALAATDMITLLVYFSLARALLP